MTTVLLVDDDPLQARVRKNTLGSCFRDVRRVSDAAEAFILVEDAQFARGLGLVVVGLSRPGLGSAAFVAELTSRLPAVPVLVLGRGREEADFYDGVNVRLLARNAPPEQLVAACRQMLAQCSARVA